MSALIVIPARYASSRFPGKPLQMLRGAGGVEKSLIHRSWDAACQVGSAERVVVATDDDRIRTAAEQFGAEVVMTSETCRNGTERCAEAARLLEGDHDIVVNLQGDAPLTPPWFVEDLIAALQTDPAAKMATPVLQCEGRMLNSLKADRKVGRVGGTTAVFDTDMNALYFSKEVVPFTDETFADDQPTPVFHHVGVYAYRRTVLDQYADWLTGPLEHLEGLEQLRFLENGRAIRCVQVDAKGRAFWELNNPEDIARLETMMADMGME